METGLRGVWLQLGYSKKGGGCSSFGYCVLGNSLKVKGLWTYIVLAAFWIIWMEKNCTVIEGTEEGKDGVPERVKFAEDVDALGAYNLLAAIFPI